MSPPPPIGARHTLVGQRVVPKHTKISEETADALRKLARQAEKSESDFIATLIEIRCHGKAVVQRIQAAQLEVVSGEYQKGHLD
jgi:hypothetical protein